MSRLTSRYSEGELSDSPVDMADDISLSLSEDDQNRDVLDIKPPQPQAGSRSRSKTTGNSSSSSRDRGHDRRGGNSDYRGSERIRPSSSSREGNGKSSREERRPERRHARDPGKEDLRERLERERRLRMGGSNREREETVESRDNHRRKHSSSNRDRPSERSRREHPPSEPEAAPREERPRKREVEIPVVSSPESGNQMVAEEEQEPEAAKESSSSSSESSDEGEASSSSTASHEKSSSPEVPTGVKANGQHQSPDHHDTSLEDEPEVKRRRADNEVTRPASVEPEPVVVEPKEELPPYLPAIMGCRSVSEFLCLNKIEEGTYGVVYRAEDKRTKEIVALKRLKMEREKEGFPITSLREVSTLLKAQHENIVTVREVVVGSNMDSIFMVMDYVEHDLKSLMELLKSKKQFFVPGEIKCLMIQLLRAVAHLHDNWILHRDLKTSNILLSHSGILKVGDFGLAREYGSPLKPYTSVVVTLWYRAPELLLGAKEYSTPIDVWSVGCIFGELLLLEPIFPGKFEADQVNRIFRELGTPNEEIWPGYNELPFVKKATFTRHSPGNLRKKFNGRLNDLGLHLMQKFLMYDPRQRITAEEALNHIYLKESPYPIHPSMFSTWPAKSESHGPRKAQSPKPPSGGRAFKQLGDNDEVDGDTGFHMGSTSTMIDRTLGAGGAGFSLKF